MVTAPELSLRGAKRRGNLGKALPIYTECRRTQSPPNLTAAALVAQGRRARENVAALTAQPLAALPPYGCGVPLAGSERLAGLQQGRYSFYGARPPYLSLRGGRRPTWQSREGTPRSVPAAVKTVLAPRFVIARRPEADVAISQYSLG